MKSVSAHKNDVLLSSTVPPSLIFDFKGLSNRQKLSKLIDFFAETASHGENSEAV